MSNLTQMRWKLYYLSVVIIIVLPSVALITVIGHVFARRAANADEAKMLLVKRELAYIGREGDNRYYVQKRLNHFYGLLSEEEFSPANIARYVSDLKSDGMPFVNLRFYNHVLQPLELPDDPEEYRVLTQRIFAALSQLEREDEMSLLSRHRSFIKAFLGEVNALDVLYGKSDLMRVMLAGRPGYFYWNTFHSRDEPSVFLGGMLVYFHEEQLPSTMAIENLIGRANDGWEGEKTFGCIIRDSSLEGDMKVIGISDVELPATIAVLRQMKSHFQKVAEHSGALYAVEYPDASTILFAKMPSAKKKYDFYTMIFGLFLGFGAIASSRHFLTIMVNDEVVKADMAQLFATTLSAFGLVCLVIAMGGIGLYVTSVSDIQRYRAKQTLIEYSQAVDSGYAAEVRDLEALWRKTAHIVSTQGLDSEDLARDLELKIKNNELTRAFFVNKSGLMRKSVSEIENLKGFVHRLIPVISRRMFAARESSSRGLQDQMRDMMVDSVADNIAEMLTGSGRSGNIFQAFEETGRLNELYLGNRRYYVFSDFVQPENSSEPILMILWHDSEAFSEKYLYETIRRNNEASSSQQPVQLAMVPVARTLPPYPAEFLKYPFSIELTEHILGSGVQQSVESDVGGEQWLIMASPLKQVPHYLLFAMYPSTIIDSYTSRLLAGLLFAALSIFSALLFVGWSIGRLFEVTKTTD